MNKTAMIAASRVDERRALTSWMALQEIDILSASNGIEAIEQMALVPPDLVLAQLSMNDMSGLRLAHYLRAHAGFADVPVILLCQNRREMDLAGGQWPTFLFESPVNPALIAELQRELGELVY